MLGVLSGEKLHMLKTCHREMLSRSCWVTEIKTFLRQKNEILLTLVSRRR